MFRVQWCPVSPVWARPDRVPVPRTVLLLNRSEVQSEFLSIAQRLSSSEPPQHSTLVLLLQHLYQATFGSCCDLDRLQHLLKVGRGSAHPRVPWERCSAGFPTQNRAGLAEEKGLGSASWRKKAHFSLLKLNLRSEVFCGVYAEGSVLLPCHCKAAMTHRVTQ